MNSNWYGKSKVQLQYSQTVFYFHYQSYFQAVIPFLTVIYRLVSLVCWEFGNGCETLTALFYIFLLSRPREYVEASTRISSALDHMNISHPVTLSSEHFLRY